jgi:hypothetical protein
LAIKGVGTVKLRFKDQIISIPNVRYIPDLSESVCSLFVHIQCPDHSISSSYDDGLFIKLPEFTSKAVLGHDDIYLDAVPSNSTVQCSTFESSQSVCRHQTQFDNGVDHEISKVDNLLLTLRHYFQEIKTRRQLNMEVLAGFRHESDIQHSFRDVAMSSNHLLSLHGHSEDTPSTSLPS